MAAADAARVSRVALAGHTWGVRRTVGMGAGDASDAQLSTRHTTPAGRARSIRRKILGGVVGGLGGFFGGMLLGAAIEGDRCDCDDPGLVGAVIGAPVGATAGGILGYKFLF